MSCTVFFQDREFYPQSLTGNCVWSICRSVVSSQRLGTPIRRTNGWVRYMHAIYVITIRPTCLSVLPGSQLLNDDKFSYTSIPEKFEVRCTTLQVGFSDKTLQSTILGTSDLYIVQNIL